MAEEVKKRLTDHNIQLELTDAAKEWLAKEGFDPVYGARPLRRAIQRFVENELSKKLLAGEFSPGDKVTVETNDDGLKFRKNKTRARPKKKEKEPVVVS